MRSAHAVSLGCLLGLGLTAQLAAATCDPAYVSEQRLHLDGVTDRN